MAWKFRSPEDREILDAFTCLRHHRILADAGKLLAANSERFLKSPEQMAAEMLRVLGDQATTKTTNAALRIVGSGETPEGESER